MSGVYFLFDKGRLIYIGQSINVEKRLSVHHVEYDAFRIIQCHTNDLLKYERRLINYFKPTMNQPTGGKRKGAGRKEGFRMKESEKKEPTKPIRVPLSLIPKVKKLIKDHKKKK
jgi:hypothetical protein